MADEREPREEKQEQAQEEVEDLELEEVDADSVKGGKPSSLPFTG
jgi:hypothetical protein